MSHDPSHDPRSHQIGVYDIESAERLLLAVVKRFSQNYDGPTDAQALIQYLEALLTIAQK